MPTSNIQMRKCLAILILLLPLSLAAQELNCTVTINSDKIEGSNKSVFTTLQQAITEYVNTIRWTGMTFAENERIECSMMIIINSVADNVYNAELQVQARRPVFGTTYTTPLLNIKDNNFNFQYQEFDRLEYQENIFYTNLTAMLAYYCYLIIGEDMDSFSRLGGTPFFTQCENIINACQTATMSDAENEGWSAIARGTSNRNRYAIANNLLDESYRKYREFYYEYHRLSLDEMTQNVANSRARIAEGITALREARKARPNGHLVSTFLDAKSDELVNIFKKGTADEKKKVYEVLVEIDPTRSSLYDEINNAN